MSQQTTEQTIKVGVIGAGGRMGRMLIEAVQNNPKTILNAAIERQGSSLVGADAGEVAAIGRLEVQIVDELEAVINDIDVLIDFSLPDATEKTCKFVPSIMSRWLLAPQDLMRRKSRYWQKPVEKSLSSTQVTIQPALTCH
ncbi:hypothetical protein PKHYL_00540 [Psychrobacter sp. KH172YL61]|nr:hypothetical protein PKHYL_00540 [Psychrobacter sp. KH172YL61]